MTQVKTYEIRVRYVGNPFEKMSELNFCLNEFSPQFCGWWKYPLSIEYKISCTTEDLNYLALKLNIEKIKEINVYE